MSVKLLTVQSSGVSKLYVKVSCTLSSESTLVKMSHCLKSHVASYFCIAILEGSLSRGEALKTLNI